MDAAAEGAKLKSMLVAGLLFLVSAYFAWAELQYATGGTKTDAEVIRTFETRGRRGRTNHNVEYRFTDDQGESRKDSDTVSSGWQVPADNKVSIEYLDGRSRLAGHTNWVMLAVFFGSLVAIGITGFRFWREVREATRPARR